MALSWKAWIAVLAVSVPLTVHNHTKRDYGVDYYKLQSYSYVPSHLIVASLVAY